VAVHEKNPVSFFYFALLALLLSARAVGAAEIGVVEARTAPGGAHTLSLVIEQATFDWPLTVRRNDSGTMDASVTVDATTLLGPAALSAENQRLLSDGQAVERAPLQLPSLDQAVVRLTGSLPVKGDFVGQLGLIVDGKRIPYEVTITRRDPTNPMKVAIVGAGSDNKLAKTSDRAAFEWPIIIRRDDALAGNADVRVRSSVMTGPSGRVIEPKLVKDGKPLPALLQLAPMGQESLALTGEADVEGTYSGEITIETGSVRTAYSLTLTRARPGFELKVDPISRLRGTVGNAVALRLQLLNPTGAKTFMDRPSLRLDRVDTSGSAPVEIGTADYSIDYKLPNDPVRFPLSLKGDRALDLIALISGIDGPGNYKGTLRFTAPDRVPLDVPFELDVRLWGGWAVIAIFGGVVLAGFLRYVQQRAIPSLKLQQDADSLGAKLASLLQAEGADLTQRERQVITTLIGQVNAAKDDLAANQAPGGIQTTLDRIRQKLPLLPLWIAKRRQVDGLRPVAIGTTARDDLATVSDTLAAPDADDARINNASALLNGIDGKIREAQRNFVTTRVNDTTAAIDAFPPNDSVEFQAVRDELAAAQNDATNQRMTEAIEALNRARSLFATTAARLLNGKLATAAPALGFTPAQWASFVAEMRQLIDLIANEPDPERQVQRWYEANRHYLVEVIRHAKTRIDALVSANIQGAHDRLADAATHLANALNALATGNVGTAQTEYETAVGLATQPAVRQALTDAGNITLGAVAGADAPAPASGAVEQAAVIDSTIGYVLPLPLGQNVDPDAVRWTLLKINGLFTAIILLFAVLSGLQLLYFNNPTFGVLDLVTAFLWGAGLHAVGGQAFQGLTSLARQFQ
jgi:hypothetical protein